MINIELLPCPGQMFLQIVSFGIDVIDFEKVCMF